MIFHEIHSAYYRAVANILALAVKGELTDEKMKSIVQETAFGESVFTVIPNLKNEKWQLLHSDLTTPLQNAPTLPLSDIEMRWLKSLYLDPRVRLFANLPENLRNVPPLFTPEDYVIYDQYAGGDPYFDEKYIGNFRSVLNAIREKRALEIEIINRSGRPVTYRVMPRQLEYSEKDDKFRILCGTPRRGLTINLGNVISCRRYDGRIKNEPTTPPLKCSITLKVIDERNALERCMLHFSHFEKQAERISEKEYRLCVYYDRNDETEMVIRVLSFGPRVEVVAPQYFRNLIIERLKKQKSCE
ncbi:MAG: WYL domain-containing protein [Ruminococcaceae bacterium]|nr:WYL domain-containing protein [Oscillospiraceae bacterium]